MSRFRKIANAHTIGKEHKRKDRVLESRWYIEVGMKADTEHKRITGRLPIGRMIYQALRPVPIVVGFKEEYEEMNRIEKIAYSIGYRII